ncbi:hypothetical protein J4439_05575 [Candidatus Woesearchaeota archaeon]|nr:hypothetical protein [Candidatus Woesearchaeota archaeon]
MSTELIDFSKPMIVLRVGEKLRKPYHKKPFIYIDKSTLGSEKHFVTFLNDESRSWDNGTYILKAARQGDTLQAPTFAFAQFQREDGKVRALQNGNGQYLCWEFFRRKQP